MENFLVPYGACYYPMAHVFTPPPGPFYLGQAWTTHTVESVQTPNFIILEYSGIAMSGIILTFKANFIFENHR